MRQSCNLLEQSLTASGSAAAAARWQGHHATALRVAIAQVNLVTGDQFSSQL